MRTRLNVTFICKLPVLLNFILTLYLLKTYGESRPAGCEELKVRTVVPKPGTEVNIICATNMLKSKMQFWIGLSLGSIQAKSTRMYSIMYYSAVRYCLLYRMSPDESTVLRENFPKVNSHRYNQK